MTRENVLGLAYVAFSAFLVYGCASEPNPSVQSARDTYQQAAQNEQIKQNAPVKLYEADQALQRLNTAVANKEDPAEIDHLAYLVEQRTAIAKAAAQQQLSAKQIEQLNKERAQLSLELRQAEAQRAQEKVSSLEEQLQQIKQASVHEESRGVVLTLGDVFFDTGKSTLNPGSAKGLDPLVQFLKENPQRNVVIEGYTDSVGSAAYNRQLSYDRARAVIAYLASQGIARDRVIAHGYGEAFPVASNETAAGRQLNRRVEVVVLRDGQPPSTAMRPTGTEEVERFSELDKDKNGYLSKTETQSVEALSNNFDEYDRNHDDRLSRAEFSAFEEAEIQQQKQQEQQPQQQP